jgi:hypothetical protein
MMAVKTILFAGVAAAAMFAPVSIGTASANDTYSCNGSVCYDDQADETRALNNQALEQAERENEDDGDAYAPGYPPGGAYQDDDDDAAPYSYGDRGDVDGDDDDTNPAPADDMDDGDDD